jgi:hypothetical protein
MPSIAPLARYTHDHAGNSGGMNLYELEKFLDDIRHQPLWRQDADIADDYYDGNQMDSKTLSDMQERGIPPIIQNLIAPTIDMILGLEARTRKDWIVRADESIRADEDVAEALTIKLKEAERMSRADNAMSEAFAYQIKSGIGWVEVGRPVDPFEYKYRCDFIHRRDMWYDWRARRLDLSDARYIIRRKWFDKDYVLHLLPQFSDIIESSVAEGGFGDWVFLEKQLDTLMVRGGDFGGVRDSTIDELEWRDTERDRVALYETWYKKFVRGYVFRLSDGRVIEFDRKNERHKILAASGNVKIEKAVFSKIRLAWWLGPHRLMDMPSPYSFDRFPYVPFIGKRESRTGVPYGLIRGMIAPQDEVNARRAKMMWLLSARRVITDADAVFNDDHAAVMNEIARPDAYVKLNPNRVNKSANAFRVEDDIGLSIQQFRVYEDSKNMVQDVGGVFNAQLGKETTGQSGVAIASLVEQGTQTLGEILDNTQDARETVGNMLLSLVKEDMSKDDNIEMRIGKSKRTRKKIIINNTNETDDDIRTNDVLLTKTKVVLDDVPSSPTHKAQMLQQFTDMTRSLTPELQAVMLDIVIEMTDMPNKEEAAERVRKFTGQDSITDPEEMTPEELEAHEQKAAAMQKQQQLQEQDIELAMAERQAKIAEIYAKIDKMRGDLSLQEEKIRSEERRNDQNNETRKEIEALKADFNNRKMQLEQLEKTMSRFEGMKNKQTGKEE